MDWIYWDRGVIGPVMIGAEEINGLVILRGIEGNWSGYTGR